MSVVDVGGFGGNAPPRFRVIRNRRPRSNRPPRKSERIWFWKDIFRHINASWKTAGCGDYAWTNADRKILANLCRKYGVPAVMAMWDFYLGNRGSHFNQTHGSIFGMANDGERLRTHPDFQRRSISYSKYLNKENGFMDPSQVLNSLGL